MICFYNLSSLFVQRQFDRIDVDTNVSDERTASVFGVEFIKDHLVAI
jgi:hypothetical protein